MRPVVSSRKRRRLVQVASLTPPYTAVRTHALRLPCRNPRTPSLRQMSRVVPSTEDFLPSAPGVSPVLTVHDKHTTPLRHIRAHHTTKRTDLVEQQLNVNIPQG